MPAEPDDEAAKSTPRGGREVVERASIPSAREQLEDIVNGVSESEPRHPERNQPEGPTPKTV